MSIHFYRDDAGAVGEPGRIAADDADDALRAALMHAEHIMREAEAVAVRLDDKLADIALAPGCTTHQQARDAEHILTLASAAAEAMERLHVAIWGKRR